MLEALRDTSAKDVNAARYSGDGIAPLVTPEEEIASHIPWGAGKATTILRSLLRGQNNAEVQGHLAELALNPQMAEEVLRMTPPELRGRITKAIMGTLQGTAQSAGMLAGSVGNQVQQLKHGE